MYFAWFDKYVATGSILYQPLHKAPPAKALSVTLFRKCAKSNIPALSKLNIDVTKFRVKIRGEGGGVRRDRNNSM